MGLDCQVSVKQPLPGWAVDNDTSVKQEAEPYASMTPEQRGAVLL